MGDCPRFHRFHTRFHMSGHERQHSPAETTCQNELRPLFFLAQRPAKMNIVQGAGVEAVLPKVPASSVHPVDVLRIPEIRATDGLRQRLLPCGHADKMNVIRHQAVTEHAKTKSLAVDAQ